MYGTYGHGWMLNGGMALGGLWMILVWAIPLLLVFALIRYLSPERSHKGSGRPDSQSEHRTALEILSEAYARGEVDRDAYLRKRDDLQDGRSG